MAGTNTLTQATMTKEQIIEEAKKRGIVEGAVCRSPYGSEWTVGNPSNWRRNHLGGWSDMGGAMIFESGGKWATVVTATQPEGLENGDACECSKTMRDAILELAVELGLLPEVNLCCDLSPGWYNDRFVTFGSKSTSKTAKKWHTPEVFIAKMRAEAIKPEPPIMIGKHKVEFEKGGDIKVGCTPVDFATLEKVYNKALSMR